MSLLLDALKKAADEKNKAADTAQDSALKQDAITSKAQSKKERVKENKQGSGKQSKDEIIAQGDDFDLSLDDEALQDIEQQDESMSASQKTHQKDSQKDSQKEGKRKGQEDYDRLSEVVSTNASEDVDKLANNIPPDKIVRAPERAGGNYDYDVSDEALNLLIHKTNRNYRKNKIILVVLVSVLSLTVLISGGLYFTDEMQSEVSFLETRHKQSMRLVREKTSNESLPDKSAIIENLVGDENLAKKVEFAKTELAKKNQRIVNAQQKKIKQKQNKKETGSNVSGSRTYASKSVLSIEKNKKADPVSLLLDEAWLAYEAGDFERSDNTYEKVLRKEKNNRDALLGRGAIALQNKSFSQAKAFYLALLEINPRDPDAIAALSSLAHENNGKPGQKPGQHSSASTTAAKSERYLKNLLLENKQSPVLNFSLGNVYAAQGRWKLAQEYYFKAWANDNNNPGYAYNLAVSLDQMGKANEAKRFYQKCLQLSKNKKVTFSKQSVLDRIVQIN